MSNGVKTVLSLRSHWLQHFGLLVRRLSGLSGSGIGSLRASGVLICSCLAFGLMSQSALANSYHVDLVVFTPKKSGWLDEEVFPEVLPERWSWLDKSFPLVYLSQQHPLTANQTNAVAQSDISGQHVASGQQGMLGNAGSLGRSGVLGQDDQQEDPLTGALRLYQDANLVEERLIEQEQRQLQRSGRYRVVFQASFIEEFKELSQAKPYWLASETQVLGQSEAFGWLQFYKGRFLHVNAQWLLTKAGIVSQPAEQSDRIHSERSMINQDTALTDPVLTKSAGLDSDKQPTPEYWVRRIPIKQHQKLKSNALYYLDHPGLGVLIMITPVNT